MNDDTTNYCPQCATRESGWVSVKNRLPEMGVKVLTFSSFNEGINIDYMVHEPEPFWACRSERAGMLVTHWMPLPQVPHE